MRVYDADTKRLFSLCMDYLLVVNKDPIYLTLFFVAETRHKTFNFFNDFSVKG